MQETTCNAFPDEIPSEIWDNHFLHDKSYEGDGGIQFEKQEDPEQLTDFFQLAVAEISLIPTDDLLDYVINQIKKFEQLQQG